MPRTGRHPACKQQPPRLTPACRPQEEQKARSTELGLEMEVFFPSDLHAAASCVIPYPIPYGLIVHVYAGADVETEALSCEQTGTT